MGVKETSKLASDPGWIEAVAGLIENGGPRLQERPTFTSPVFLTTSGLITVSLVGTKPKSSCPGHSTCVDGVYASTKTIKDESLQKTSIWSLYCCILRGRKVTLSGWLIPGLSLITSEKSMLKDFEAVCL